MDNEIDGYASDVDLENELYSPERFILRRPAYTQQSFENLSQSGRGGQNTISYFGYEAQTEELDAIDGSAEDLNTINHRITHLLETRNSPGDVLCVGSLSGGRIT